MTTPVHPHLVFTLSRNIAPQASVTVVNLNISPRTWRKYWACYLVCRLWRYVRMHWCLVR